MRMLSLGLQLHEIHDVDDTNLQLGRVPAEEVDGSESLQRRHVSAANHYDVGLLATVVAGPLPDSEPGSTVLDRLVHRQPLWSRLFAGDDDIQDRKSTRLNSSHGYNSYAVFYLKKKKKKKK